MGDYMVTAERGHHRQSIVVSGDIAAWLRDKGARETKRGFTCRGWRLTITPLADGVLSRVRKIIGTDFQVSP